MVLYSSCLSTWSALRGKLVNKHTLLFDIYLNSFWNFPCVYLITWSDLFNDCRECEANELKGSATTSLRKSIAQSVSVSALNRTSQEQRTDSSAVGAAASAADESISQRVPIVSSYQGSSSSLGISISGSSCSTSAASTSVNRTHHQTRMNNHTSNMSAAMSINMPDAGMFN